MRNRLIRALLLILVSITGCNKKDENLMADGSAGQTTQSTAVISTPTNIQIIDVNNTSVSKSLQEHLHNNNSTANNSTTPIQEITQINTPQPQIPQQNNDHTESVPQSTTVYASNPQEPESKTPSVANSEETKPPELNQNFNNQEEDQLS